MKNSEAEIKKLKDTSETNYEEKVQAKANELLK